MKNKTKRSRKPTSGEQLAALLTRLPELHPSVLVALLHYGATKEMKDEIRERLAYPPGTIH